MSAGMHVFVAPNVPLRCSALPQLRYYFSIAGAIIIEDMATLAYRRVLTKRVGQTKPNKYAVESEAREGNSNVLVKDDKLTEHNELKKRSNSTKATELDKKRTPHHPDIVQKTDSTPTIARAVGYVWVACFEVWSTSKFLYLTQQCLAN